MRRIGRRAVLTTIAAAITAPAFGHSTGEFNTLGFHTPLPRTLFRQRLAYVQAIQAMRVEIYWGDRQELPDVFSTEFEGPPPLRGRS